MTAILCAALAWTVLGLGFWALFYGSPDSDDDVDFTGVRTHAEVVEHEKAFAAGGAR